MTASRVPQPIQAAQPDLWLGTAESNYTSNTTLGMVVLDLVLLGGFVSSQRQPRLGRRQGHVFQEKAIRKKVARSGNQFTSLHGRR